MEVIKPYEKYKDSGISWLGEIPEHWKVSKAKHILFQKKKTLNPDLNCGSISFGKIVFKDNDRVPFETKATYQELLKGEFLINPLNLNFDLKSLRTGLSRIDVVVSTGYIVLQKNSTFNENYLKWLLHQFDVSFMKTLGDGVRQTLSYTEFKNTDLPYISVPEQTAIANFLDYKTAKIDRFIFKKKQLIKLLNEQKAAIINDAVTKGLNPNTKMKPSGIEWLGDIPEHWEVEGFNKNVYLKHGFQFREEHFSKEGIRVVKITQLSTDGKLRLEKASYVPFHYRESYSNIIIKDGDILMALTGGTIGKIIRADINEEILLQNYRVGNFYPINEKLLRDFLYLQLRSEFIQAQMAFFVRETGQPNIGKGDFRKIKMVVPPTSEQQLIVSHIEKETSIITKTIATIEKEIALVQEYRTALIAEAVTGKIDVRDYNVPSFEEDKEYAEMEEEMGLVAEEEIHLD